MRFVRTTLTIAMQSAVVVVKWSACMPSTLAIQVPIPLKTTVFSVKFVFENIEIKQKEAGVGSFFLKNCYHVKFEKSQLATVMELFSKQNALSFNKMLG